MLQELQLVTGAETDIAARQTDERNKQVISENCVPFTNCISDTNNTKTDAIKDINVVMLVYDLIEYINNYYTEIKHSRF